MAKVTTDGKVAKAKKAAKKVDETPSYIVTYTPHRWGDPTHKTFNTMKDAIKFVERTLGYGEAETARIFKVGSEVKVKITVELA